MLTSDQEECKADMPSLAALPMCYLRCIDCTCVQSQIATEASDNCSVCACLQAVKLYSEALESDSTLAAAYNNRALAHLKLNNLADAEADCGYVLQLEPRNVKALLRRGSAR